MEKIKNTVIKKDKVVTSKKDESKECKFVSTICHSLFNGIMFFTLYFMYMPIYLDIKMNVCFPIVLSFFNLVIFFRRLNELFPETFIYWVGIPYVF